jgi:hypothetical protein
VSKVILGGAALLLLAASQGVISAPVAVMIGIGLVIVVNAIAARKSGQC